MFQATNIETTKNRCLFVVQFCYSDRFSHIQKNYCICDSLRFHVRAGVFNAGASAPAATKMEAALVV